MKNIAQKRRIIVFTIWSCMNILTWQTAKLKLVLKVYEKEIVDESV